MLYLFPSLKVKSVPLKCSNPNDLGEDLLLSTTLGPLHALTLSGQLFSKPALNIQAFLNTMKAWCTDNIWPLVPNLFLLCPWTKLIRENPARNVNWSQEFFGLSGRHETAPYSKVSNQSRLVSFNPPRIGLNRRYCSLHCVQHRRISGRWLC